MKNRKMFDAMSQIDSKYISRAAEKRDAANTEKETPAQKKTAFKRFIPAAVAAVLIFAITLSAVLIANRPSGADGQPLMIGFDTVNEPVVGARLAIKTEKQKIALGEDLKISAYCVCGTKDDTAKDVTAKLLMSYSRIDPDNMIETVKEIDDGKESGYTWNGSFKNIKSVNITVPAAAFTKAEVNDGEEPPETDGVVVLALDVNKEYSDGTENEEKDSAALYYKIEDDEVYLNVSDETMDLARAAVEKLRSGLVFLSSSSNISYSTTDEYNTAAKWVAPELTVFEKKKDAAAALITLYEELLEEFRKCDLDWYFETEEFRHNTQWSDRPQEYNGKFSKIRDLIRVRRVIETLLALDCYYDMLNEAEVERMLKDFDEYLAIYCASASKFYDDVSKEPLFYRTRRGVVQKR
ncbi:MAG: hypothetical protein II135_05075 [Clostridia bacterium]|nr:hypothetical protein [Clostridia bacterium]